MISAVLHFIKHKKSSAIELINYFSGDQLNIKRKKRNAIILFNFVGWEQYRLLARLITGIILHQILVDQPPAKLGVGIAVVG